jgi:putative iron-only hydrogenase system regulator
LDSFLPRSIRNSLIQKKILMEKRIGAAVILIENKEHVDEMNHLMSMHSSIILARQGVPLREKGISIITLILEGTTDQISALTGKIGRLEGVQVKSVLTKYE